MAEPARVLTIDRKRKTPPSGTAVPPPDARGMRVRVRFGVGVLLGALVAAFLSHGFVSDARKRVAAQIEERKAVVALQALVSLVQRAPAEGARGVVSAWQAGTPAAQQVRVTRDLDLIASTAPGDVGDRIAPRALEPEEKPLFDRGQRIATAVGINREEGAPRKEEIEAEPVPGGRVSLAAPLELDGQPSGTVELVTAPLPPPPQTPWGRFLLAVVFPVLAFGLLSLIAGERRWMLAVLAVVCLAASLIALTRQTAQQLAGEYRDGARQVSLRVQEQAKLAQTVAAQQALPGAAATNPSDWDADIFRRPRGELKPDGSVDAQPLEAHVAAEAGALRKALFTADALALALLLLTGFGFFNRLGSTLHRNRQAYFYIAPAIFGMLVLVFYPFSYGVTLSFTDSNLYNTNKSIGELWIGLGNYKTILGDFNFTKHTESGFVINYLNFYYTLIFTIIWTVTNVTIGVTSGLVLALILNTKGLAMRPVYRVLLILPWALPNYITALIWKGMFHQQFGVVNHVLQMFGIGAINWFDRPFTSYLTALATNGWLSFPFMMVVSLGALQSIPADLYEAARVDGATRWQQFRAITLPSLRPALVPAVILSVVWTFNMFNIIYLVTAGEPGGATEILVTQAFKFAFERYRYGYAAAYSMVIFMILLVYGVLQNRYSKATEA